MIIIDGCGIFVCSVLRVLYTNTAIRVNYYSCYKQEQGVRSLTLRVPVQRMIDFKNCEREFSVMVKARAVNC